MKTVETSTLHKFPNRQNTQVTAAQPPGLSLTWCLLLLCFPVWLLADEKKDGAPVFEKAPLKEGKGIQDPKTIAELNSSVSGEYTLGPGDQIEIVILGKEELSGEHTIGPDGIVTLPLAGGLNLNAKTRDQAADAVLNAYSKFYTADAELNVILRVITYTNNRVFVLGRVEVPGMISLEGRASLLEVLSRAGAISTTGVASPLRRCAIIRGKNQIIWVSLSELLYRGNMSLNLTLANNDVVYIPYDEDAVVYVMGEVVNPGAIKLTAGMSFLDVLMRAGGPNEDSRKNHMKLVRNQNGEIYTLEVRYKDLRKGDLSANVVLQENDIIFVGRKGMAHINYFLRQLDPFLSLLVVREALTD